MGKNRGKWRLVKNVPITWIMTMVGQTLVIVWFAGSFSASVNTKLDDLSYQIAAINADKYTKTDAQKDFALYNRQLTDLSHRQDKIELLVDSRRK